MKDTHFDIDLMKSFLDNLTNYPFLKLFLSFFITYFHFLFEGDAMILASIYSLGFIDTITGFAIAIKRETISSRGFFRVGIKCLVYFLLIFVSRVVDKSFPLQFASSIMNSFIIGTEAISILENFAKLNFPVPQKVIEKLRIAKEEKK